MKIIEIHWKSMKSIGNQWYPLKINENLLKINEIHWSAKIHQSTGKNEKTIQKPKNPKNSKGIEKKLWKTIQKPKNPKNPKVFYNYSKSATPPAHPCCSCKTLWDFWDFWVFEWFFIVFFSMSLEFLGFLGFWMVFSFSPVLWRIFALDQFLQAKHW